MDNFSNNIKTLRECLKLTQTEFGNRLGKRYNTIQNWEKCRAIPDLTTFEHICSVFNVSPSWLRDGVGEMFLEKKESNFEGKELTRVEKVGIEYFMKLPPEKQELAFKYIQNLQSIDNAEKEMKDKVNSLPKENAG